MHKMSIVTVVNMIPIMVFIVICTLVNRYSWVCVEQVLSSHWRVKLGLEHRPDCQSLCR